MSEPNIPSDPASEGLLSEALLYASGRLSHAEATAFEQRLAFDPLLQDALCRAVRVLATFGDRGPIHPDPAFRDQVRQRLGASRLTLVLGRSRHVLLRGALATAALVLLALSLRLTLGRQPRHVVQPVIAEPAAVVERPRRIEPPAAARVRMASVWAELHTTGRLARVTDEETRKRSRADDLQRLARMDEGRVRFLLDPPGK